MEKETYAEIVVNRTELKFLTDATLRHGSSGELTLISEAAHMLVKLAKAKRDLNPLPTIELKAETITDGEVQEAQKPDASVPREPVRDVA